MFFKNRTVKVFLSTIFTFGVISIGSSLKAQNPPSPSFCSNRILRGYYSLKSSGFVNSTSSGGTPFNLVFLDRFDGNGNITGVKGSSSTGGVIAKNLSDTGTYQVNSDCTVTLTFNLAKGSKSTNFGVIVDNGKKLDYIGIDSGVNISGQGEKIGY